MSLMHVLAMVPALAALVMLLAVLADRRDASSLNHLRALDAHDDARCDAETPAAA